MTVDTADDLYIPTYDDVLAAHERVRPYIHRTPVLTSRFLNELTGAELFFKCENFQKAAAFKVRGACNAVFGLSDAKRAEGRRHPFQRQPRAVALLRRRPARHPLHRRHAAHRAAGEEGRGDRLRRQDRRMRALDLVARGGLRRGGQGRDRRRLRAPLQRRAGDRRAGHLLQGDDRGPRRARRRRRPDRRRRHDLRHLPDAVEHRAEDEDLRRRAGGGRRRLPVVQAGQDHRLRRAGHGGRRPEGAAEGAHLALRLEATSPTC